MKPAAVLAAMMLLAVDRAVASDENTSFEKPERWGTPRILLEPAYPKDALESGKGATIDLDARVGGNGALEDIELHASSAEDDVFIEAIRKVVGFWRYYPPIGDDCLPSADRIKSQVAFEVDGGKPRVFVQRRKGPPPKSTTTLRPLKKVPPVYPRRMIEWNREALVYARAQIDPQGKVVAVRAEAYPRREFLGPHDFEDSVRNAGNLWIFPPANEVDGPRFYCFEVIFNLRD